MRKYDYLIIGCGLFGITFAQKQAENGKRVLIIEKRNHIGGNCYTEQVENINIHFYGPHIFHTSDVRVWRYINNFATFNFFVNRPKVRYKDKIYSFPINLMTLYQLYGVKTPFEAKKKLDEVKIFNENPDNLEDWMLSEVGSDIYNIFIKGYTRKQWQITPKNLPADLAKRIPIRFNFNDNYFNDQYQGVPIGGYTKMFEDMLRGVEVKLDTDYFDSKDYWDSLADRIVYTGKIDEYFGYKFGQLGYRGLKFKNERFKGDYQGNAVVNYTEEDIPYTRIIEHKHFESNEQPVTVITKEFPAECKTDDIPYYPINTKQNNRLYEQYKKETAKEDKLLLGGRLATYKYMDMDDTISSAINLVDTLRRGV
jgi:UDP-galactopyranose mutase